MNKNFTASRLMLNGIVSRREKLDSEKEIGNTSPKHKKPKTREPLIAFSVSDLKLFLNLTQLKSPAYRKIALNHTPSFFVNELKLNDNVELNDVLGCRILSYYNQVFNFIPKDLPQQVIIKYLEKRNAFKDGAPHELNIENIKQVFAKMYSSLFDIKSLYDCLKINQMQDFWKLTELSIHDFIDIYSKGEIPPDYEHIKISSMQIYLYKKISPNKLNSPANQLSDDKTFRLWLAFAFELGIIDKSKIIDEINKISMKDFDKFEHLRSQFFG